MLTMWYLAILHHLRWAAGPPELPAVTALLEFRFLRQCRGRRALSAPRQSIQIRRCDFVSPKTRRWTETLLPIPRAMVSSSASDRLRAPTYFLIEYRMLVRIPNTIAIGEPRDNGAFSSAYKMSGCEQ